MSVLCLCVCVSVCVKSVRVCTAIWNEKGGGWCWDLLSMLGPAVRGAARRVGKTSRVGKTETKGSGRERQELGAGVT